MAGGKSLYLIDALLKHVFKGTGYTMPANLYLALTTSAPAANSTGGTIVEATYTGYARKQILTSDMGAPVVSSSPGTIANTSSLVFANCTAGSSNINGFAVCDSAGTGTGNVLYWGTISPAKTIDTSNQPATVGVGALVVSEA